MTDATAAHLDALEAQARLLLLQVQALRHALAGPPRVAEPPLPDRCRAVPEHLCARQSSEARVDVGGMGGGSAHWICRGCGEEVG